MKCSLCFKDIYVTELNKTLCPTCFKMMLNLEIQQGARYQAQGHTLKCSLVMANGKRCICGKVKYYNGFISKMIKEVKPNITYNFNTL